jgi:DNA-binding IclR family transcriptional regulator
MGSERDELEIRWALGVRDRAAIQEGRTAATGPAPRTAVGVLDRCVAIIDAVSDGSRSFSEIVRVTGIHRSTAHRMIGALEAHGFLFQVGGYGYALGPRLLALATTAMRELPLRRLARPALERLARFTGEGAQLFIRDGDMRVCVDSVQSRQELRTIVQVGASLPLDKGSAGKVLLAWGSAGSGSRIVEASEDPEQLGRDLHTTRRRGWAYSNGEREVGVASVSAPVRGPDGELLAAVSASGPTSRILPARAKDFAPAVLEAAKEIEQALGYQA